MINRLKLSDMLHNEVGIKNVYFQPPPSKKMEFPCIVYRKVRINTRFANNKPYWLCTGYEMTYITSDPDSKVPDKLAQLPRCVFERDYDDGNQYYSVFRIT